MNSNFTTEQILQFVKDFDFDYCQLQTGLNKFELTEILEESEDFFQCWYCHEWKHVLFHSDEPDECDRCFKINDGYY